MIPAGMNSYYSGPLCESWFRLEMESVDDCMHQTCWAIMCIGDSMVSYWFKAHPAPVDDVRTSILHEMRTSRASAIAIRGFVDRLRSYSATTQDRDFVRVIPNAITNFEEMAKEYDSFTEKLKDLAGRLGIQDPGS